VTQAVEVEHRLGWLDPNQPSANFGVREMRVRPRSASPLIDDGRVDLTCERLDALSESLHCFRELSVLLGEAPAA